RLRRKRRVVGISTGLDIGGRHRIEQNATAVLNRRGPAETKALVDRDGIVRSVYGERSCVAPVATLQRSNLPKLSGNAATMIGLGHEEMIEVAVVSHPDKSDNRSIDLR